LNTFSIVHPDDNNRKLFGETFEMMKTNKNYSPDFLPIETVEISRCIASYLGLAICDALGAST